MCLAQGHNTVTPVRLEFAAPQSLVKHSTTESLHTLMVILYISGGAGYKFKKYCIPLSEYLFLPLQTV